MTTTTINRSPPPAAVAPRGGPERGRPLLTLRLSDGRTWAHEFGASSPHDLRDGCMEAWIACRMEWQRRAGELPTYQTRKRALILTTLPQDLQLHILDTTGGQSGTWLNANHGTRDDRMIVIRQPGTASNGEAWEAAPWLEYWRRCMVAWWRASELSRFLQSFIRDLALEDRMREAMERWGDEGRRQAGPAEGASA